MQKSELFIPISGCRQGTNCCSHTHAMNTFAVAKHTGKRVFAEDFEDRSTKYSKGYFVCIDCGKEVHLRRGDQRAWHFCHYHEGDRKKCSHANGGETKEHFEAKHFVAKNIRRCAFAIEKCPMCKRRRFFVKKDEGGKLVMIHECKAEVEKKIAGTCRVADVVAIDAATGSIVAAIEILHTHAVDEAKKADCAMQGVVVLEVTTKEVQRCMSILAGNSDLLQLETTCMKRKCCIECKMYEAYARDMESVLSYEAWYTNAWEVQCKKRQQTTAATCRSSCDHSYSLNDKGYVFCTICNGNRVRSQCNHSYVLDKKGYVVCTTCNGGRADYSNHDHVTVLLRTQWYDRLWKGYAELLVAQRKDVKRHNNVLSLRRHARESAHKQIQEYEFKNRQLPVRKRGKCIGKCKQCGGWIFDEDEVCEISSMTMPECEWNDLFVEDPPQYRKKYMKKDEHNSIYVHKACSMECPQCCDDVMLHKIAMYGMCFSCNTSHNVSRNHHVECLKTKWSRNGEFELVQLLK